LLTMVVAPALSFAVGRAGAAFVALVVTAVLAAFAVIAAGIEAAPAMAAGVGLATAFVPGIELATVSAAGIEGAPVIAVEIGIFFADEAVATPAFVFGAMPLFAATSGWASFRVIEISLKSAGVLPVEAPALAADPSAGAKAC
jgi:hypothetical protein